MATFHAIAATSRAILKMLEDAVGEIDSPTVPNVPKPSKFELYHPSHFENPMDECVSILLYRVAINGSRRSMPPRRDADGRSYRPSLPLDLHYLITPWAKDVETQQRWLGWLIRVLEDTPVLPAGLLNEPMDAKAFYPSETVELICDPLPLQDLLNLWDKLKPKMQTSITYIARIVFLESKVPLPVPGLSQTREFGVGQVVVNG